MRRFILFAAGLCAVVGSSFAAVTTMPSPQTDVPAETPQQRDARMQWWREARFGMFIHWGLYAIPAGQWNGNQTKGAGEWIMNDLKIPRDEYARLAGQFDPQHFDAAKWAAIAKEAGMKYIVITTKHHEGFSLFDSKFSDYDVMAAPFKRDVMKELAEATRAARLQIGWYHSILDWHDPDAAAEETFPTYEWRLRNQVTELLSNYGPIGVMWFDGEWIKPWNDERGQSLYKLCRSLQPDVIVNNRVGKQRGGMAGFTKSGGFSGDYATPEQQLPDEVPPGVDWETCMTMNGTWGFTTQDTNFKTSRSLIRDLIDIASRGGNFLLNVGPTADGDIPDESVARLRDIGQWMNAYGESIYGTTAGPFRKLSWGRATAKPNKLYLHVFDWPADGKLLVPLRTRPTQAYLLASNDPPLDLTASDAGVTLTVGNRAPNLDASVIVLELGPGQVQIIEPKPATTTPATSQTTNK